LYFTKKGRPASRQSGNDGEIVCPTCKSPFIAIPSTEKGKRIVEATSVPFRENNEKNIPCTVSPNYLEAPKAAMKPTVRAITLGKKHNRRLHILQFDYMKQKPIVSNDIPLKKKKNNHRSIDAHTFGSRTKTMTDLGHADSRWDRGR